MPFSKITETVLNVSALADTPNLSANALKAEFDKSGTTIKNKFNSLIDDLIASTGASNLGASSLALGDNSAGNIQSKLQYLLSQINDYALGNIPDNTITEAKLESNYSRKLMQKVEYITCTNNTTYTEQIIASIPTITSNEGTRGWVPISSNEGVNHERFKAFDNNVETYWCPQSSDGIYNFIGIKLPNFCRLCPTSISYATSGFINPILEGSLDNGITYVTIQNLTNSNVIRTDAIDTNSYFTHFRIRDSVTGGAGDKAYHINFAGTMRLYINNLEATMLNWQYTTNNIIGLKFPVGTDNIAQSKIKINDFSPVVINNIVENGNRQYIYNGSEFVLYSPICHVGTCVSGNVITLGFTPSFVLVGDNIQDQITSTGFTASNNGTYIAFR